MEMLEQMTEAFTHAIKAALLPELKELKEGQGTLQEGLKVLQEGQRAIIVRLDAFEERTIKQFGLIDQRFEQVEKRFEQVEKNFAQVEKNFAQNEKFFGQMEKLFEKRCDQIDKMCAQIDKRCDRIDLEIAEIRKRCDRIDRENAEIGKRLVVLDEKLVLLRVQIEEQNARLEAAEIRLQHLKEQLAIVSDRSEAGLAILQRWIQRDDVEPRIRALEAKVLQIEGTPPRKRTGTG